LQQTLRKFKSLDLQTSPLFEKEGGGARRSNSLPVIDGKLNPAIHTNQSTAKSNETMKELDTLSSQKTVRNTSIVECEVHALPAGSRDMTIIKILKSSPSGGISPQQASPQSPQPPVCSQPPQSPLSINDISPASLKRVYLSTKSTSLPIKYSNLEDSVDGGLTVSDSSPNLDKTLTKVNLKHKASKQIMISATNTFFPYITVSPNVNQ